MGWWVVCHREWSSSVLCWSDLVNHYSTEKLSTDHYCYDDDGRPPLTAADEVELLLNSPDGARFLFILFQGQSLIIMACRHQLHNIEPL